MLSAHAHTAQDGMAAMLNNAHKRTLADFGLRAQPCRGDASCLFEAFAVTVGGGSSRAEIRQLLADVLRRDDVLSSHPDLLAALALSEPGIDGPDDYARVVTGYTHYGTHTDTAILCTELSWGLDVYLARPDGIVRLSEMQSRSVDLISLLSWASGHWDLLVPL